MSSPVRHRLVSAIVGALLSALPACSNPPTQPTNVEAALGQFNVLLTSSASGAAAAVGAPSRAGLLPQNQHLDQVVVYMTGAATRLSNGVLVTFNEDIGAIDLLTLRDREFEVIDAQLLAGTYDFVEFTLDPSRCFVVVDGQQETLHLASNPVRVNGPFVVPANGVSTVRVNLDVDSSVMANVDGSYTLNPVLVATVDTG